MDKEPVFLENFSWSLIGGVLWYLAARYKPWLLVVLVPMPALHFISLIGEIRSSHGGPKIFIEAGPLYVYSIYGLFIYLVVCSLLGLLLRRKALQRNKSLIIDDEKIDNQSGQ